MLVIQMHSMLIRLFVSGKTLADQIGTCREESKASRARFEVSGGSCGVYSIYRPILQS